MKFKLRIGYMTPKGPLFIAESQDGRFHPMWKDEPLGSYRSIVAAVEDAAGGHVFTPSDGTDLGELGVSSDPGDWVPAAELM